jgi:hypothetical protein
MDRKMIETSFAESTTCLPTADGLRGLEEYKIHSLEPLSTITT